MIDLDNLTDGENEDSSEISESEIENHHKFVQGEAAKKQLNFDFYNENSNH